LINLNETFMKAPITLLAILMSTGFCFGQDMPAEATPYVAQSVVSYTADATVQTNAGNQTFATNSQSNKATSEGTATVNPQVKAAAARADGSYTVAYPQTTEVKNRKNNKKKTTQPKIR